MQQAQSATKIGGIRFAESMRNAAVFLAPIVGALLLWELVVQAEIVSSLLAPAPSLIVERMWELGRPSGDYLLWKNLWASFARIIPAFAVAAVTGVMLGIAIGISARMSAYFSPLLSFLLPLPAVAWTPVLVVSIGRGYTTMLIVLVLGAVFPILYNVVTGVRGIKRQQVWAVRSMGGTHWNVFWRVIIPASLPSIITGFKVGMAHTWRTMVAVELLTSAAVGLGALIFNSRSTLDTPTMYASVVMIALVGFAIENILFNTLEARTVKRWGKSI